MRAFAPALVAIVLASSLGACKPKMDTSSQTAFVTSYTRMRLSLDDKQRERLDAALVKTAFKDVNQKGILEVAQHLDQVLPHAKAAVNGKTAEQIIASAGAK